MADKSSNLGLNLPVSTDKFDHDIFLRQNFQTIDTKLKANIVQEFTAIAGQTVFTLSNAYTMGQGEISVELDGVKQKLGSGYNETTPTSITLLEGLSVGAKVKITIIGLSPGDDSRIDQINASLAETVFYDEITWVKYTDSVTNTDYHITTIPNKDKNGNSIVLKHGYAGDSITYDQGETARNFSDRYGASFVSNGGVFNANSATSGRTVYGISIQDGVIKKSTNDSASYTYTLGIKADNTLVAYDHTKTADQILADGSVQSLAGFVPFIQNGVAVDSSLYTGISSYTENHARSIIAQMPNKDILFFTTNGGGTVKDKGMTYADMIRVVSSFGVSFAYCLDGGGSSQVVVRGNLLNIPVDDKGKTERLVADFIYVVKQSTFPQNLKTITKDTGSINKRVSDLRADLNLLGSFTGTPTTVTDCNAIQTSGDYWCLGTASNAPNTSNSWGIIHFQVGSLSALQIAFPYNSSATTYPRYRICDGSGNWQTWTGIDFGNFGSKPITVTDFNTVPPISGKYYGVNGNIANAPATSSSWVVDHTQIGTLTAIQVAYSYDSTGTYPAKKRICNSSGVWQAWSSL